MSSPVGSAGSGNSDGNSVPSRQARSAELKNRRRITKAIAAKRSRAQHGQYVQQLSEECDVLRDRIRSLRLQRDVDAVAHAMVTEMSKAISGDRAETLQKWLQASSLEGLVKRAEEKAKVERDEREQADRERRRADEEREALDDADDMASDMSSMPQSRASSKRPSNWQSTMASPAMRPSSSSMPSPAMRPSSSNKGRTPLIKPMGPPGDPLSAFELSTTACSSSDSSAASTMFPPIPLSRNASIGSSTAVPLAGPPPDRRTPTGMYNVAGPSPRLAPYVPPYLANSDAVHAPRLASLTASLHASCQGSPALGPARGPTPPIAGTSTHKMLCLLEAAEGLADMADMTSGMTTAKSHTNGVSVLNLGGGGNGSSAPSSSMMMNSYMGAPSMMAMPTHVATPPNQLGGSSSLRRMASEETAAAICILAGAANGGRAGKRPIAAGGVPPMAAVDEAWEPGAKRGSGVGASSHAAEEADDGDEDDEDGEEDDDETYCFCGTRRHLKSTFRGVWVQCDECQLWCHGECAKLRSMAQAERAEHYVCPLCKGADPASLLKTGAPLRPKRPRARTSSGRPRGRPPNAARTAAALAARKEADAARKEAAATTAADSGTTGTMAPPAPAKPASKSVSQAASRPRFKEPRKGERGGLRDRSDEGGVTVPHVAAPASAGSDDDGDEGEEEEEAGKEAPAAAAPAAAIKEEDGDGIEASRRVKPLEASVDPSQLAAPPAVSSTRGEGGGSPAKKPKGGKPAAAAAKPEFKGAKVTVPNGVDAAGEIANGGDQRGGGKARVRSRGGGVEGGSSSSGGPSAPAAAVSAAAKGAAKEETGEKRPAARFSEGARVLVKFDNGVEYPGVVNSAVTTGALPLYSVHFDDGDEFDDVKEEEMRPCHVAKGGKEGRACHDGKEEMRHAPRYGVGDRVSVDFSGKDYEGTGASPPARAPISLSLSLSAHTHPSPPASDLCSL